MVMLSSLFMSCWTSRVRDAGSQDGLASVPKPGDRNAFDMDRHCEEAARQRKAPERLCVQPFSQTGEEKSSHIGPAKAGHGRRGDRNWKAFDEYPLGCVSIDTPGRDAATPI